MIRFFPDYDSLSHAAADLVIEQSQKAVRDRGCFSLVLCGGQTPRRTYEILAQDASHSRIPWDRVSIFWSDERCVPPDDPRSNERMARGALIDRVPIPSGNVHPLRCTQSPAQTAESYELLLTSFLAGKETSFDVVLLGLGEDGHTASLFPESESLDQTNRWVLEVHAKHEDFARVTLALPVINRALCVVFLVTGEAKAHILFEVLNDASHSRHLPAQLVQPSNGQLIWLVDEEAAKELDSIRSMRG
jgi:6-phosphogluconolactonase